MSRKKERVKPLFDLCLCLYIYSQTRNIIIYIWSSVYGLMYHYNRVIEVITFAYTIKRTELVYTYIMENVPKMI